MIPENPIPDVIPPPNIVLDQSATYLKGKHDGFIEGGEAYTKALIEWLFEECTGHQPYKNCHDDCILKDYYPSHRFECEECMQELKLSGLSK